jgi:Flp pilus assembly protein TadD
MATFHSGGAHWRRGGRENIFPANLFMGRMLSRQQKAATALRYLRKAATLRPDAIDAHRFLSDAYAQLGEASAARR